MAQLLGKWIFALMVFIPAIGMVEAAPASCSPLLSHTFPRLQDEAPQNLCQYQGKVLLVVNTASFCGFTGQYEGLEKIYAKYKDQGLVVLGFPSNDSEQPLFPKSGVDTPMRFWSHHDPFLREILCTQFWKQTANSIASSQATR